MPKLALRAVSKSCKLFRGKKPKFLLRRSLSIVLICSHKIKLFLVNPLSLPTSTCVGKIGLSVLLVINATITQGLNLFPMLLETTTQGRKPTCSLPIPSLKSAKKICPFKIIFPWLSQKAKAPFITQGMQKCNFLLKYLTNSHSKTAVVRNGNLNVFYFKLTQNFSRNLHFWLSVLFINNFNFI